MNQSKMTPESRTLSVVRRRKFLVLGCCYFVLGSILFFKTGSYYGGYLRGWDAQYYYAQAHSIAFDFKMDLTSSINNTPHKTPFDPDANGFLRALPRIGSQVVNKYPIGTSLLEIPFMRVGEWLRLVFSGGASIDPPGYSNWAILTVGLGLIAVSSIGLATLQRLLEFRFGFWPSLLATCGTWFGTSLLHYSAIFPFMSHGVAFTLVVLIIWQTQKIKELDAPKVIDFTTLGILFGFLFLVRPQQILLIFWVALFVIIPLFNSRKRWLSLMSSCSIMAIMSGLQLMLNYGQVGSWTLNAYSSNNEGFSWFSPNWQIVLLSPSRGLFWMNPIVLISVPAILFIKPITATDRILLLHSLSQTYLIACWSSPEQGDSFGPRMLIECVPLVAMGLCKLSGVWRTSFGKRAIWLLASVCILWTNLLMLLYLRGQLTLESSYSEIVQSLLSLFPR